ncbi:MAG TPA: DUF4911 domain-containing protein [Deltaproteobacteria bacterium]|nr:DUF4911 domain-containing protein [Deltaproteobacteria bacterium]
MINKYCRVKRENISFVQFILEAYEGMATISTIDSREALIRVSIMPDFISEISDVLLELKKSNAIEKIDDYR